MPYQDNRKAQEFAARSLGNKFPFGAIGSSPMPAQIPCLRLCFLITFLFFFLSAPHMSCALPGHSQRHTEFSARNFFVFFFDRMNTADTLGWEIKNGLKICLVWGLELLGVYRNVEYGFASAAAYRNINRCHVMNHANTSGPFHSQFMSLHGLSEVGLLSARHLRQGFWGSLIPR